MSVTFVVTSVASLIILAGGIAFVVSAFAPLMRFSPRLMRVFLAGPVLMGAVLIFRTVGDIPAAQSSFALPSDVVFLSVMQIIGWAILIGLQAQMERRSRQCDNERRGEGE